MGLFSKTKAQKKRKAEAFLFCRLILYESILYFRVKVLDRPEHVPQSPNRQPSFIFIFVLSCEGRPSRIQNNLASAWTFSRVFIVFVHPLDAVGIVFIVTFLHQFSLKTGDLSSYCYC